MFSVSSVVFVFITTFFYYGRTVKRFISAPEIFKQLQCNINTAPEKSLNHSPLPITPPPLSEKRLSSVTYGREAAWGQMAPDGSVCLCVLCALRGFRIHRDLFFIVTGRKNNFILAPEILKLTADER